MSTNSTGRPRVICLLLSLVSLLIVYPTVAAQCFRNQSGETAAGLRNLSDYQLVFSVDGMNRGAVSSGARSLDVRLSPGEHLLLAEAKLGDEIVSVSRTMVIPAGHTCIWNVSDARRIARKSAPFQDLETRRVSLMLPVPNR